jgi:hypothetical protein
MAAVLDEDAARRMIAGDNADANLEGSAALGQPTRVMCPRAGFTSDAHATSYCETLRYCASSAAVGAYTPPAVPPGLNAEPGADAALPGVCGAVALPHDWLGCPVFAGPSVVDGAERVVPAVVGCPVVAMPAVESSAVVVIAAQTSVNFMRTSIGSAWLRKALLCSRSHQRWKARNGCWFHRHIVDYDWQTPCTLGS